MRVTTSVTLPAGAKNAMNHRPILSILVGALALFFGAACVDVAPPPSRLSPTPTTTPTNVPTATPVPATATLTSTVTATPTLVVPTATPFVVATQPGIIYDPVTGRPTVPVFTPPVGVPTVSGVFPGGVVPGVPITGGNGSTGGSTGAGGGPTTAWGCDGDETIQFVPLSPVVGQKVFIYVTAARDRQFVLLYGPQTTGVADKPIAGGVGLRRAWEVVPTSPGVYTYEFYAGPSPSDLCKTSSFEAVTTLARSIGTPTPSAQQPTPVATPRPDH